MTKKPLTTCCERCGAEIDEQNQYRVNYHTYRCQACAAGRACDCSERIYFESDRRSEHNLPAEVLET